MTAIPRAAPQPTSDVKAAQSSALQRLHEAEARFEGGELAGFADEKPPLRAELFGAEQMALHGRELAAGHHLRRGRARDRLLTRLAANERLLVVTCELLAATVSAGRRIAPAAEWLLDNFYLIEDQIRTA
jgi:hypothetical protein